VSKGEVLIQCDHVSKKFCKDLKRSLWYGLKDVGMSLTSNSDHHERLRKDEFWAVNDVSFELRRGECLGLIGHNGAGKSTLLKMLNGLINPDAGKITMRGRVGALIELGAGFNPILTGRENIYNNGAVLGFTKTEIDGKFDDIVDFAELNEFIDTPVQNYSSGMKVRLGFSIAAQMEPDILLIDEVLAVGDANFIVKSYNRINEIIKTSSVIFVSHNMPQVAKIVDKVVHVENGRVQDYSANLNSVISQYISKQNNFEIYNITAGDNISHYDIKLNGRSIISQTEEIKCFSNLEIDILFILRLLKRSIYSVVIKFFDLELRPCGVYQSERIKLDSEQISTKIQINDINLSPGTYSTTVWLLSHNDSVSSYESIEIGLESIFRLNIIGEEISNYAFSRFKGEISTQ